MTLSPIGLRCGIALYIVDLFYLHRSITVNLMMFLLTIYQTYSKDTSLAGWHDKARCRTGAERNEVEAWTALFSTLHRVGDFGESSFYNRGLHQRWSSCWERGRYTVFDLLRPQPRGLDPQTCCLWLTDPGGDIAGLGRGSLWRHSVCSRECVQLHDTRLGWWRCDGMSASVGTLGS